MAYTGIIVGGSIAGLAVLGMLRLRARRQEAFIDAYGFHPAIRGKVAAKYPQLTEADLDLVFQGLRDYFQICRIAGRKLVAMPSQVVDDAWHEFILFTRTYRAFCRRALGRFLHHTPAEAMAAPTSAQGGIKRAWRIACAREGIAPSSPTRLPLIFALDAQLEVPNGFKYALDCRDRNSPLYGSGYCATHIGCAAGCASGDGDGGLFDGGLGDSDGAGCSGGCGGGCGGD